MNSHRRILLVSGSTRAASTNSAALRAAHAINDENITTVLYEGLATLPAFNPDDDVEPLPPAVTDLREQIETADGVLFCIPEYAGGLPGSFKNLLDWTVGGTPLYGKPVAWINVAAEGRGANAEASLRTVLGYVGATVVAPAGTRVTVARSELGPDGAIGPGALRERIEQLVRTFAAELRALQSETP
jgi:NAD(P)H-dependent FMN reductase